MIYGTTFCGVGKGGKMKVNYPTPTRCLFLNNLKGFQFHVQC